MSNRFAVPVLLLSVCAVSVAQTTRSVPAQYPTIQSAINVCINGDNVLVAPGVYPGAINFLGKAINVHSSGGSAATTISGTPSAPAVSVVTNEGPGSILDGFTVTGGNGGIFIQNASPVIQNCRIVSNFTTNNGGGGVRCLTTGSSVASPTFTNCTIANNVVANNSGGGGLLFDGQSSATSFPTLNGCVVSSNSIAAGYNGYAGGIYFNGSCSATVVGSTIDGNTTASGAGGCYISATSASFTRCRLTNNHSQFGGAIYTNSASLTFIGCLVAGNTCTQDGGAMRIYLQTSQTALIKNCTITANSAGFVNGGVSVSNASATLVTFLNSIVWGNSGTNIDASAATVTYCDVGYGYYTPGVGTISVDPRFVDAPNGDYHLARSSPCRDTGAPGTTGLPVIDLDGTARIINGVVDIGADEVPAFAYPGTNEDLELYAWVDGLGDPLASARSGLAGSHLKFLFKSPGGSLTGANPVIGGVVYASGAPPTPLAAYPYIWLSGPVFIVVGTLNAPPFSAPGLPTAGITLEYLIPPGLSGNTVRLQALVDSPIAINGMFAVTNATEVVL